MDGRVTVVRSNERPASAGPATPGMDRFDGYVAEDRWIGYVVTEAGVQSGWHHHGEKDTYVYVVRGSMELESGPGGREVASAGPGDFVHIPAGTVHREGTTADGPAEAVVVRIGRGQPVFNVEGPDPDHPSSNEVMP